MNENQVDQLMNEFWIKKQNLYEDDTQKERVIKFVDYLDFTWVAQEVAVSRKTITMSERSRIEVNIQGKTDWTITHVEYKPTRIADSRTFDSVEKFVEIYNMFTNQGPGFDTEEFLKPINTKVMWI